MKTKTKQPYIVHVGKRHYAINSYSVQHDMWSLGLPISNREIARELLRVIKAGNESREASK